MFKRKKRKKNQNNQKQNNKIPKPLIKYFTDFKRTVQLRIERRLTPFFFLILPDVKPDNEQTLIMKDSYQVFKK